MYIVYLVNQYEMGLIRRPMVMLKAVNDKITPHNDGNLKWLLRELPSTSEVIGVFNVKKYALECAKQEGSDRNWPVDWSRMSP